MSKKSFWCIISLFVFSTFFSCKKDQLLLQNVKKIIINSNSDFHHVKFLNDTVCIIAGGIEFLKAEILKSNDGGFTFISNSYPQAGKAMLGMSMGANNSIYLCGTDGTVLYSSDLGTNWLFNRIDWNVYVGGTFVNADTGIFISTVLQRQSTITQVNSNFQIFENKTYLFGLNDIYMLNSSTGYVIGYGIIMKTTDYRKSWKTLSIVDDNFTAMDIHENVIWICGANGSIYLTNDGGDNWRKLRNGNDITIPHYGLRSIIFKDMDSGWAVGDDGIFIHSDDGGLHWAEYKKFTTNNLRSITVCPNNDLITVGDNGTIYRITP